MKQQDNEIISTVKTWLEDVVIGLQLCPFAKAPFQSEQIRFSLCKAEQEEAINEALIQECLLLDQQKAIETTLLICPNALHDFFTYNQFLLWAEQTLKKNQWRGVYQIASFHPDYCFANSEADDPQNLSNRSPHPILHLLRENSLEKILERYPNPDGIPENNIKTLRSLDERQKNALFPYLFSK